MTKYLPFVYDEAKFYTNQKCFFITGKCLKYLTAFFNSNIFKVCFRDNFPELLGGTRELSKVFFEKMLIYKPSENEENVFSDFLNELISCQDNGANISTVEKKINNALYSLFFLSEAEIASVEEKIKVLYDRIGIEESNED